MPGNFLERASAVSSPTDFQRALIHRVRTLAQELALDDFTLPIALLLVIGSEHGGDATAAELVRRFRLLDGESANVVDFYFLGWKSRGSDALPIFDLENFQQFRASLRKHGITQFGGNADLLLLDAKFKNGRLLLDFSNVVHIDLSESIKSGSVDLLGSFLQSIIEVAERIKAGGSVAPDSATEWISDQLGIAVARHSLMSSILDTWARFLGGKKLLPLATRSLGPVVDIAKM